MAQPMPEVLVAATAAVDKSLSSAKQAIEPYLQANLKGLVTKLEPLDNAKLHTSLAFVATSLLYGYLRVQGTDLKDHKVMEEVDAVKNLYGRINETQQLLERRQGKPGSKLDVEAAGRFIKAGLGGSGGAAAAPTTEPAISKQNFKSASSSSGSGTHSNLSGSKRARGDEADSSSSSSSDSESEADSSARAGQQQQQHSQRQQRKGEAAGAGPQGEKKRREESSAAGGKDKRGGSGGGGGSLSANPMPKLSHLDWRKEMQSKFGGKK